MDAFRRYARISRMKRYQKGRNQMGVEGTIMNDINRKQLTGYGHVQRMAQTNNGVASEHQI